MMAFWELFEQDTEIILKELQAALLVAHGVQASLSGNDVVLKRFGLADKKESQLD